MAIDKKITDLTADTAPDGADLLTTVDDPGGTPTNKKATIANVVTKGHGLGDGAVAIDSGTLTSAGEGTVGQVFTSNGAGVAPTFQAAGGAGTLAAVLTAGNSSGGTDINMTAADAVTATSTDLLLTTTTSGNVRITPIDKVFFADGNKGASTYAGDLALSDLDTEWDLFETNFGEVSLMNAINQAAATGGGETLAATLLLGSTTGGTDINMTAADAINATSTDLLLKTTTSGDVKITSAADVDINMVAGGRCLVDGATTPHTGITGVFAVDLITATANVKAAFIDCSQTADVDGVTGWISNVSKNGVAGTLGNSTRGITTSLTGHSGDSNHIYEGFRAAAADATGAGTFRAFYASTTFWDTCFLAESGNVEFSSYSPTINTTGGTMTLSTTTTGDIELSAAGDIQVIAGTFQTLKGGDLASANDMSAVDGNYVDVTGTTQINTLEVGNSQAGTFITFQFDGTVTVKHATGGAGAQFALAGSADFLATAGDTLMVVYDGSVWREVSRTAI